MDSRYAQNAGAVPSPKYHIVWCPKYRRPVLVGAVVDCPRDLLVEESAGLGMTIHALEVMPDGSRPSLPFGYASMGSEPVGCQTRLLLL